MAIQLEDFSRFKFSEPIVRDGKETFGRWHRPDFLRIENIPENEIGILNINQSLAGRPDLISQQLYGTPLLMWVVVLFNRPLNPTGWPKAGTIIRVPSSKVVYSNV